MKVALAQINTTVGDVEGNTSRVVEGIKRGEAAGADLVVFPELAVFGYPPKDLVRRGDLVRRNVEALEMIANHCHATTAAVGYVQPVTDGSSQGVTNSVAICAGGRVVARYSKMLLPTYDVFDESRYFQAGTKICTVDVATGDGPCTVGVTVCEDLWNNTQFEGRNVYGVDPIERTVSAGAQLLINLSGSPFRDGVQTKREALFAQQIRARGTPLVYVNLVGGNDDLIFDGASLVMDGAGQVVARAKAFAEDFLVVDVGATRADCDAVYPERLEALRQALVLGISDYIRKCGFESVVIGLSGGIDSALTAALAVEALGAKRVLGVALPSRFSSSHSLTDARALAERLGLRLSVIEIEDVHQAYEATLAPVYASLAKTAGGVAEENIQARIRGNLLMAISNKTGALLLTTGNKSELGVGYCTLYGDMCGGLAVLSDVPKTVVYALARHINSTAKQAIIPQRTIDKPPSAELRDDQCDQDTLPPYDVLDAVLAQYVEDDAGVDDIVATGYDRATVQRIVAMVDRSEFKRKQAAVGLRVTSRAFGTGRRMPIAAKYR